ncbi:hypothetical protein KM043_003499 [Ampulex compressa]|nr:hypothetical protein KM043_003499 [Ampulex compressa]
MKSPQESPEEQPKIAQDHHDPMHRIPYYNKSHPAMKSPQESPEEQPKIAQDHARSYVKYSNSQPAIESPPKRPPDNRNYQDSPGETASARKAAAVATSSILSAFPSGRLLPGLREAPAARWWTSRRT